MCGIAGAKFPADRSALGAPVLRALQHRGPDGAGEARVGSWWLGHTRLAIIDLSADAAQPMTKPGCGTIVFNGEIYDHAAHRAAVGPTDSRSDTEVLLRLLATRGVRALDQLHGMYAFAWLAPDGATLTLARDHAGMKPLYLLRSEGRLLAFASEVRALCVAARALGHPLELSRRALAAFLTTGSVPEPLSTVEGIEVLPASHAWTFDARSGAIVTQHRTSPVAPVALASAGDGALVRGTIERAVARHLVADCPVALYLSGGIDSSALAVAAAASDAPRPTAITVTLGSAGTEDETAIVRDHAARLGLPLHEVDAGDWMTLVAEALGRYDQPSIDGLNTYVIAHATRTLGFRVALSGVGADEVFGGYRHLRWPSPNLAASPLARAAGRAASLLAAQGRNPRLRRAGLIADAWFACERAWAGARHLHTHAEVERLVGSAWRAPSMDEPEDALAHEQRTYLRNTLLKDTDAMGMARSVEIRAPYLDPDVLALGRAIGARRLLDRRRPPKWPLREAFADSLPSAATARKKSGFTLALDRWMKGPEGRERVRAAHDTIRAHPWFDTPSVHAWSQRHERGLASGRAAGWVYGMLMLQTARQLEWARSGFA